MKNLFTLLIALLPVTMMAQGVDWQKHLDKINSELELFQDNNNLRANCEPETHYQFMWDSLSSSWDTAGKAHYLYFSGNTGVEINYEIKDSSGNWQKAEKIEIYGNVQIMINAEGLDSLKLYLWDTASSSYMLLAKILNKKNSSGQTIEQSTYIDFFGSGTLMLFEVIYFTYNANGEVATTSSTALDLFTMQMAKSDSSVYDYNSSGDLSSITYYSWNVATQAWELTERDSYTYNANGEVSIALIETYDGTNWQNDYKVEYTYTSSGKVKTEELFYYLMGSWNQEIRVTNNYDANDCVESSEQDYYDASSGSYKKSDRLEYVYPAGTGIGITELPDFKVYPNPANDILYISTSAVDYEVEVFDMIGKTVLKTKNATSLNVSDLKAGNYFIRIRTDDLQTIRQIIIQ